MDYEVEGVRPRGKPKKRKLRVRLQKMCKEDAMDRRKWRKLIKYVVL